MRVNLGCGNKILPGWVNLDKHNIYAVDLIHDLEKFPYPFPDNSCHEILMNHVLEHLGSDVNVFNGVIRELYRISAHNARLYINVPHPRHDNFLSDPTHVRPITPDLLRLYDQSLNKKWEKSNVANTPLGLILDVDFTLESTHFVLEDEYQNKVEQGLLLDDEVWALISERNNIAREVQITLRAKKVPVMGGN